MWVLTDRESNIYYKFCEQLPRMDWYVLEYLLARVFVELESENDFSFIEEVDAYDYVNKSKHVVRGRTSSEVWDWIMMMVDKNKKHLEKRYVDKNITIDVSSCEIKTDKEFFELSDMYNKDKNENEPLLEKLYGYAELRFPLCPFPGWVI